jgi:hypothetical protein
MTGRPERRNATDLQHVSIADDKQHGLPPLVKKMRARKAAGVGTKAGPQETEDLKVARPHDRQPRIALEDLEGAMQFRNHAPIFVSTEYGTTWIVDTGLTPSFLTPQAKTFNIQHLEVQQVMERVVTDGQGRTFPYSSVIRIMRVTIKDTYAWVHPLPLSAQRRAAHQASTLTSVCCASSSCGCRVLHRQGPVRESHAIRHR